MICPKIERLLSHLFQFQIASYFSLALHSCEWSLRACLLESISCSVVLSYYVHENIAPYFWGANSSSQTHLESSQRIRLIVYPSLTSMLGANPTSRWCEQLGCTRRSRGIEEARGIIQQQCTLRTTYLSLTNRAVPGGLQAIDKTVTGCKCTQSGAHHKLNQNQLFWWWDFQG